MAKSVRFERGQKLTYHSPINGDYTNVVASGEVADQFPEKELVVLPNGVEVWYNYQRLSPATISKPEGRKDDAGKVRLDLLPARELRQVGEVLTKGAAHYGENNWKSVPEAKKRYLGAALRHIFDYMEGTETDKDSGLHPLAHAMCDILFLMHFVNEDREVDGASTVQS